MKSERRRSKKAVNSDLALLLERRRNKKALKFDLALYYESYNPYFSFLFCFFLKQSEPFNLKIKRDTPLKKLLRAFSAFTGGALN